ncbi:2-oxo-4-hydroxy-4-carboxy-5-ureidoimidazoline decarboxylase [Phormidium sp. CLA17]|uniref:2-oxo-4-hydroxy-4-carboxy-5-ureidoimidazoline decarboxylase n=1 Tax=Leptolyngbya sp. Cla-17 TaxID=2803751 RepID=UPI0014926511|nr:2-oxo-4-hydroxy-4-carboxy-5-ureidoimidazoline decarboxylase [Leptolyngbya sp. Cla-17]MBM0744038.1 2-oxo-4-hydroxy-4-carboxy-5-ureidoimidazoline decarboxylase [Leptolyngbya sp. Cla-17]
MGYSIADLNQMSQSDFVAALGAVFEETPAIAERAWNHRPFSNQDDLHRKMVGVVNQLDKAEQLSLIQAHPDLGSKAKMADASVAEQAEVGLDRLTASEYDRFHQLNQAYKIQFGFPFIIAVKNHTKASILQAFEHRLKNDAEAERQQALLEIIEIARFRLHSLIG